MNDYDFVFQDWTSVTSGQLGNVSQGRGGWLDLLGQPSVDIHMSIRQLVGGTLHLETAASEDGTWTSVKSWSVTSPLPVLDLTVALETCPSAEYQLQRFLRWRFEVTTANGIVCFRATATAGGCGCLRREDSVEMEADGGVWQDWVDIELMGLAPPDNGTREAIQGREQWLDMEEIECAVFSIQAPHIPDSGGTLYLETSDDEGGAWTVVLALDSTTRPAAPDFLTTLALTSREDAPSGKRFSKLLRWRATASAAVAFCFKIVVVLKSREALSRRGGVRSVGSHVVKSHVGMGRPGGVARDSRMAGSALVGSKLLTLGEDEI